ncbi:chemotaxis protein CheW [Oscillospiraceae bacterium PP1C4]
MAQKTMINLEQTAQKGKFLTFCIANQEYGIEIENILEIIVIDEQTIIPMPEMPEHVRGIVNLRGSIIPVVDISHRFKMDHKMNTQHNNTCIIIVDVNSTTAGFIVDEVQEVLDIKDESISMPPQINRSFHEHFIKGIGKTESGMKLLLDCEKLLYADSLDMTKETA